MGSPESSQSISQSVREEGTRRTRGGERNKGRKEEVVEEETMFG